MNTKNKKKEAKIKLNKNIIKVIIGIVILCLSILIITKALPNKKNNTQKYLFDENKLISVYKNGLYGFINSKGKEVVKIQYDYVVDTAGKYVIVEKDGTYFILDNKGNEKVSSKTSISYNQENDIYIADSKMYNSNLNIISPKNLKIVSSGYGYYRFISEDGETAGVINSKGKVTYKQKIKKGDTFYIYIGEKAEELDQVYCSVSPNNKTFSIINCDTGKVVYDYTGEQISAAGNNIFYIGQIEDAQPRTVYISNDKIVLESKEKINFRYHPQGYIEYTEKDQTKFFNTKTNKLMDKIPSNIYTNEIKSEFEKETGYTKISCTKQYGVISDDDVLLPCSYDKISFLPYGLYSYLSTIGKKYVIAQKEDKTDIINLSNKKTVHTLKTDTTINALASSPFVYYYNDKDNIVIYNLINNKEEKFEANYVDVFGNYFRIHKDNKLIYYNTDFKKIYEISDEK